MPDWSYRTLLQPALLALGPERAQAVVVRTLSILGSHPVGLALIDFMGHMRVDPRLAAAFGPMRVPGPVGLAGTIDPYGTAAPAFSRFGVAQVTVVISSLAGFSSFFLFLGFGYFDPFHAFVTAVLFQFVLLVLIAAESPPAPLARLDLHDDAAFRRAQWGQLLFIAIGIGLLGAGAVITVIGCTEVFVRTDLEFLRTTAASLLVAHERLVPLVAHDRASLGGMLIANGLAVWLSAQWGLRAGALWLWRALALGGHLAFASAIGVHFVVGYLSFLHLAPAFAGWALWCLALLLTRDRVGPRGSGQTAKRGAASVIGDAAR